MLHFFVILCLCVWLRWTCAPLWSVPVTACTHGLSFHSLLAVSFGGVRCYSKRSSFWILGYFDHWLARSACRQRVSLLLLLALLSPCMSSMAMFLGTIARASLCLHFTFFWRRRCTLWIDFCADKLIGNKENECFYSTLCVTLCYNDTLTVLERAHDLPLRMFFSLNHHDRGNNEEYMNTRTIGLA